MSDVDLDALEVSLGYRFGDRVLLETALAHSSYAHETDGDRGNERLEFLGDAVLDLVVAHALFDAHPNWNEGDLTRTRAGLVNQHSLARRAEAVGLGPYIRLGRTERRSGGSEKDSILANCFEAIVGAIYLDGGAEPAREFTDRVFAGLLDDRKRRDAKTEFQEWAHQRHRVTPRYETLDDSGTDDDDRRFTVVVRLDEREWGTGVGRSKRIAERKAAAAALERALAEEASGG